MSLRIVIVDDEEPARARLRSLLTERADVEVVGEAADAEQALTVTDRLAPDIVLLDIRMPGMDGLEVARLLADSPEPPAVIFTTAFDEYALDAFDAKAVAYLLKPIRREKLEVALAQASRLTRPQLAQAAATARLAERQVERRSHIAVRQRETTHLIPVEAIIYFQADRKYTTVRHLGGEHLIEESLRSLEDEFGTAFVRIHRNSLVCVARLQGIDRDADGQCFVRLRDCSERLAVSRRMAGDLRDRFRL